MDFPTSQKITLFRKVLSRITSDSGRDIRFYPTGNNNSKSAFIYYKLIKREHLYAHVNTQEIIIMIETLHALDFDVTLVDRSCSYIPKRFLPERVDLYLGVDGCGGANHFFTHLRRLKPERTYLIMTVQPPRLLRERLLKRDQLSKSISGNLNIYPRNITLEDIDLYQNNIHMVDYLLAPATEDADFIAELNSLNIPCKKLNYFHLYFWFVCLYKRA